MIPAIKPAGRFFLESSSSSSSARRTAVACELGRAILVCVASEGEEGEGNAGAAATAGSVWVAALSHTAVSGAFT